MDGLTDGTGSSSSYCKMGCVWSPLSKLKSDWSAKELIEGADNTIGSNLIHVHSGSLKLNLLRNQIGGG